MKTKSRRQNAKNNVSQSARNGAVAKPAETIKEEMVIQFGQIEITTGDISDKVKNSYKENGGQEQIKEMKIYVKPEENKAYYVINGNVDDSVDLA